MSVNLFDTRTMAGMITEGEKKSKTFFRDRYFKNRPTFNTAKIDFDVVGVGERKLAPFVHPKIGGVAVDRKGFRTESYEAPEISPMRITTAEDMLKRSAGETIYSGKSPSQRAAEQLGKDLAELDDMISRREEVMCREAVLSGRVTIQGEGYDEVIDYWGNVDESERPVETLVADSAVNVLKGLRTIRRGMIQKAGFVPTEIICGTNALDTIIEKLIDARALDSRRVDMGQIDPRQLPNGVTYWGYLKDSALDVYSYDDWYFDDATNAEVAMMPENQILMASPNVRTSLAYGVVGLIGDKTVQFHEGARIPDSWVQKTAPAGRVVQIKSRPLPIVHQIYGFRTITVTGE